MIALGTLKIITAAGWLMASQCPTAYVCYKRESIQKYYLAGKIKLPANYDLKDVYYLGKQPEWGKPDGR